MYRRPFLVLVLLLAFCQPLLAQRTTATVRGTVTDEAGAVIEGAKITLINTDTGFTRENSTNASGNYSFGDVPIGYYVVEIAKDGFKTSVISDLQLNVADIRKLDVELSIGAISEEITTVASAVLIETVGGEVAGLVTGEQVRELPLNGRNFVQLTQLMPGVSTPEGFDTKNKGMLAGVDMSVSGGSVTGNLWTVDGANNNDTGSNRTILIYPSVDAIEEFKIHRNSYGAEFGGAGGAQVNLVTRGGTNDYAGSVYGFFRDDSLNETNFFLDQAGLEKEPLSRDDYGFTVGGPIVRDKLHFFVSQEWNDEQRGVVRTGFVPTLAERSGDFSGSSIAGCSPATPVDPLTGNPFPGNVIPNDRLSAGGLNFLNLYPEPNVTPVAGSCNNWISAVNTPIDWQQQNYRVDYTPNNKTRLMLRYTADDWENGAPNAGESNGLWGDDQFPAVDSSWNTVSDSIVAQLNQTIGDSVINTIQISNSANEIDTVRGGLNPELNNQINSTIPAIFGDKTGGSERSHPVFWGGQGYAPLWNMAPWDNELDIVSLKDDYQQVFGNHWVKAGVLYSQSSKRELIGGSSAFETPQFWGATGVNGWGATTGNVLADFLLRDMTFGFSENSFEPGPDLEWDDIEVYVSDSWQMGPRVTFDYGIRYSRFKEPVASDNSITSFDPNAFDPALGNDPCNGLLQVPGTDPCGEAGFLGGTEGPSRSLVEGDDDNFAPRLGLAWDVFGTGNSVLRAGFGQFYQRERVNIQLEFAGNPPFTASQSGIRKLDDAGEPCGGCFSVSSGIPRNGIDPNLETPYNWQWNLTWEQRLGDQSSIEVSYVGNRGKHLYRRVDINQVPDGDVNGNGVNDRLEYVRNNGNPGALGALRPFSVFGDNTILQWRSDGFSDYDALQTQYVKRFGRGSQIQASYTLSRFKSNDPLDDSGAGTFDGQIIDLSDPSQDFGYAALHRDHVFNGSILWNLPTLDAQNGFVRTVLGNWTVGGIVYYSSGQALTVTTGSIPGINGASGTGFTDNQRPNRVSGVSCSGSGGTQILNPNAFTINGLQLGENGTAERGECEGPDFFQVDLSFYKNFRLSERIDAQFRIEVFNLFNRDNFISVDTEMNPSGVTLDSALGDATQIVDSTIPSNFGQATGVRDPRQIQLGFKLLF